MELMVGERERKGEGRHMQLSPFDPVLHYGKKTSFPATTNFAFIAKTLFAMREGKREGHKVKDC